MNGEFPNQGLNFILGGNYQQDRITEGGTNTLAAYSGLPPNTGLLVDDHTRYQALGFFANFGQEVFSQLTLTGGVRYTMAKERLSGCLQDTGDDHAAAFFGGLSNLLRGAVGLPATEDFYSGDCVTLNDLPSVAGTPAYLTPYDADLSQDEHNIAWRGGLNYKPTADLLLYALVSRGFKAGGIPAIRATNATQMVPVKQEELTSYETGIKSSLFDRMLQFNAAVFYYQYYNKQFYTVFPSILGLIQTNSNIPQSMENGADIDMVMAPIQGLTLRAALTYINTDIHNLTNKYYWTNVYNPADTLARFTGLPRTFGATVSFNF